MGGVQDVVVGGGQSRFRDCDDLVVDGSGRTFVTIRFDDGHGLAVGDAVRHRGIKIGRVDTVRLLPDLAGIEVDVALETHAGQVARDGSRFWIVHPELDINGVRGLDTAIGAKYIRVTVSRDETKRNPKFRFEGLSRAPPLGFEGGGIEIVLRGDDRYGLSAGSPLTFRGIEIGQVISSGLAPDAKHVDTVVRVQRKHVRLVNENSKFWKTSGIDVDVSLSGVEFSAQSLATVMRGGVGMATPGGRAIGQQGEETASMSGRVFRLFEKVNPEWLDSQAAINVLSGPVPPTVLVELTWSESKFGFKRSRASRCLGILRREGKQLIATFPRDVLMAAPDSLDQSTSFTIGKQAAPLNIESEDSVTVSATGLMTWIVSGKMEFEKTDVVATRRLRIVKQPEDCFVVRMMDGEQPQTLLEMIGRDQIVSNQDQWLCPSVQLSRDVWHGAPVLAASDEKLIGQIIIKDSTVQIARF